MGKRGIVWPDIQLKLVFLGPAVLFFSLIVVAPFLLSIYYGLTDWNGVTSEIGWVGLANFKQILLEDAAFHRSFWFTTRYTLVSVVLINLVGVGLALILTRSLKTTNLLRTIFFMPNVIGGLFLGFIWHFIFVKGFASAGEALQIGLFQLPWLGTPDTSFWGLVIVSVWQYSGYLMVIYIAAILNVPPEIVEAAKIDGASGARQLRSIVLPLIMPAFTICLFLAVSWCFKVFDLNLALTKGGPFKSTESVALNIFYEAFGNNRYGLGTAKALIFFVVVAIVTTLQVRFTKKREVEA
ncbi:sugar ABC transporter permease [Cohnella sp. LGH]|uniref:carbohydrate ABC transporter permease n=1 Tax=Cohnella sp. LGH TaxID=1619153 RepID=UPI001ADCDB15|nr:sugar ABC transporter permease [Cohnella sp. LGH]QTH43142.1 sugar ABC transporter permease [Cohnella sp. LGH]